MRMGKLLRLFKNRDGNGLDDLLLARTRERIEEAIRKKQYMVAFHGKEWLIFSPHALDDRPTGLRLLAYVKPGHAEPAPASPVWRWVRVSDLWGLEAFSGPGADRAKGANVERLGG